MKKKDSDSFKSSFVTTAVLVVKERSILQDLIRDDICASTTF
jgi:hypothetical protein